MKRLCRYGPLGFALLLGSACAALPSNPPNSLSAIDPHGPAAVRLAELWWVMLALGTAMFLLVIGLIFAALRRGRRAPHATVPDSSGGDTGRHWVIWGGIALPLVVIGIVFGYSIYTLAVVENPHGPIAATVEVVGRRWWWEVKYPGQNFETANEIHIPVGVPVRIQLESGDVIHSFWVPQLHGKMDAIPTRVNTIPIQADQPGVYRGECAEFCGLQHAHMGLMVVAQSSADFNDWLNAQQKDADTPTDPAAKQGQQVFITAGCVFCHTVRGLDDTSIDRSGVDLGPDLTHLSSRLTIAGASLSANEGNLAGWIVDAQHLKPGSLMPTLILNAKDLEPLLAYLATLR